MKPRPFRQKDRRRTQEGCDLNSSKNARTAQPGAGRAYTVDELLKAIEPQYQMYKLTMRQCIAGLTAHAAQLTAQGQEEENPRFRRLCIEMAEFWGLTEDDTPKGYREMAEQTPAKRPCRVIRPGRISLTAWSSTHERWRRAATWANGSRSARTSPNSSRWNGRPASRLIKSAERRQI